MGHGVTRAGGAVALAITLSGCLSDGGTGQGDLVSRFRSPDATSVAKPTYGEKISSQSEIIQSLAARRSVLPAGDVSAQVASAVLAANSRTAEAELRSATLRSEAASKNWLPTIGPQVSLTSLGSVVANLVVDQVLFDNGRRQGEREFAIADVEVAAVRLAQDSNYRVATGLGLYTDATEAREKASLSAVTLADMRRFEYIMSERVRGGVSDSSDLNILRQKLAEISASQTANRERAGTALSELNAMSIGPLGDASDVPNVPVGSGRSRPLAVVMAEAERTRAIAAAKVDRAGRLPGLSAGGTVGEGGSAGVRVVSDNLLGFGTAASLRAIEATKETATRRVSQATEDANRDLRRIENQIAAKTRQATETAVLTGQAKANLDLFQEQYDGGQRQVIDVVGVYETFARQQQLEVTLKYDIVRLRIEMAQILGVLADGSAI